MCHAPARWWPIAEFLPQGQGEVTLLLEPGSSSQIVPPLVGIADAYLEIEGTATPESSAGWIAGAALVGSMMKRVRRTTHPGQQAHSIGTVR